MPISALNARREDFSQKTTHPSFKALTFCLGTKEFARNPDSFNNQVQIGKSSNRHFLPFSRQRWLFACTSVIFPTNKVKGVLLCTLDSAPKCRKRCKNSCFLAKSLTLLMTFFVVLFRGWFLPVRLLFFRAFRSPVFRLKPDCRYPCYRDKTP